MAGEWIKMRADLHDDPAVFRLSTILKIDKFSVIGRLHTFWSWVDRHSVDGHVDGAASTYVDEVVRQEGFADALAVVGWLTIDETGISVPKFDRHNGDSAKNRAQKSERQARWRANKDAQVDGSVDGDASTQASTREEKRREERREEKPVAALPSCVPADAWSAFVEMRKKIKKPMTARAVELMFAKLERFAAAGHDVKSALERSTLNCWQDVFEPKDATGQVAQAQNRFAGVK